MIQEHSFGVIPLKKQRGDWYVLLIRHTKGSFWAFPKGHAESGEMPYQTAERELFEETGLTLVRLLSEQTLHESYVFQRQKEKIHKTVIYYLAEVDGSLHLQEGEVYEALWVPLSEAEGTITFPESKALCHKALQLMNQSH